MSTKADKLGSTSKLVIDNDAGGDDAMAIFLALLYEKHFDGPKLIGLTTANGNTNEDNVCLNNQRILKVAGRQDIPIYRGSRSSLVHTPFGGHYYGKDGLGDGEHDDSNLVPEHEKNAVTALIEESKKHKGELIVVTLGTLTNVAMAIRLDPEFISRLAHLYIGAGHIENNEYNQPEFNALMDVEAYHVVAQNSTPDKVTILPFSQVKKFLKLSKAWRQKELGAIDTDIMRAQNVYEQISMAKNEFWHDLDPAVVAAAINPKLVKEYKYSKHGIILCGDKRGINTNEFVSKEKANVRIIYSFNRDDYQKFLMDVFSADLNETK